MDPLKFSINLVDNVSLGLADIRRSIEKMKDQEIKVRLKVENKEEIEKLLGGLGGAFSGFNLQLPDFGKVISGANEMKSAVKETASELKAVKQAEDALASATAKRAKEQSKLNTLLAAESGSAVAEKVKAYTALPEEVRKRIMEINKLLASPMGQYSQSVITSVEGRMSDVRKKLDDIFGIPQSEIANFRSEFALRLRQLVQARREEIEKAKREVDDPSFQTQVINGIRMRYAGMLEGLYDKVPMGANGTPYSALRGLTQEMQMLEGQYKNLTETRAGLQAEFTSLLNQSTASATSQAAAEKAVTDATNAHAEAVKKLAEAQRESQELSKKSVHSKDSWGKAVGSLEDAIKRRSIRIERLNEAEKQAIQTRERYNNQRTILGSSSDSEKLDAMIAKYEVLSKAFEKMRGKLESGLDDTRLLAFANTHLGILRKVKEGMMEFSGRNLTEEMRDIYKKAAGDSFGKGLVSLNERSGLDTVLFGDSKNNPLEGFLKLDMNMMQAYNYALESIINNYKQFALTKKDIDKLLSAGNGYNAKQMEVATTFSTMRFDARQADSLRSSLRTLEEDIKLLTQQEQAAKNVAAAEEAAKKAAQDLAAAKENLAKAQTTEATGSKAIEAARQKVKESEEAEKKATDELTKAKEALAKVEKENASVGKKKWSEIESMNDLITRLKYMTQLTEKLKDKNLANNTGKMTDYYKNLEALGTAFNRVLGDTPKVEQSSMLEYINKVRAAYQEFLAMVNSKQATGGAFATSSFEKFDMIRHLWDAISKTGGDQGYLTSVQNQMNSIQSVIIDSIRNLIEQINRMKQTISDDNFTAYKTRIENTATAMNNLTEAFVKFQGVVGKDEGMKNFMTGLGEVINKIRFQLNSLGEGVNNMSGDQLLKNTNRNIAKMVEALSQLQDAQLKVTTAMNKAKSAGAPTDEYERYLSLLKKFMSEINAKKADIAEMSVPAAASQFLGYKVKHFNDNARTLAQAADTYENNSKRIKNALISIDSALAASNKALSLGSQASSISELKALTQLLENLKMQLRAEGNSNQAVKLLPEGLDRMIQKVRTLSVEQEVAVNQMRRYEAYASNGLRVMNRLIQAITESRKLGGDPNAAYKALDKIKRVRDAISGEGIANVSDSTLFAKLSFQFKNAYEEAKSVASQLEKTNKATNAANDKERESALKLKQVYEDIAAARAKLTQGIQTGAGTYNVEGMRKLFNDFADFERRLNSARNATEAMSMVGNNLSRMTVQMNKLFGERGFAENNKYDIEKMKLNLLEMEQLMQNVRQASNQLGVPVKTLLSSIQSLENFYNKISSISGSQLSDKAAMRELRDEYRALVKEINGVVAAQEKMNAAKPILLEKYRKSAEQALLAIDELRRKMEGWKTLRENAVKLGIDTSTFDAAFKRMEDRLSQLRTMTDPTNTVGYTTSEYLSMLTQVLADRDIRDAVSALKKEISELEHSSSTKKKVAKATNELTLQEQRLAAEMDKVAQSAKGQSQVLSDLKSMAQQYLSVYGTQQFINNIIEIGGQLENQRMSIASILGDAAQANTLFEQIQSLAVKSPFGVVELDQYTKQLSAFGFQYNELYDMTKRLADISAGAGTDVGRLALALGHVRAEGALTGYTLRQFAMNNIPMLQKLSEMLSTREGRLVSTQDIRKRVSNKQIGYEDVISVIKGLTDEGGMFYNMQEAISQSTKSKWKNLKDAMDIMYGKMAESDFVGGGLKDLATILTDLTKKWERIGTILLTTGTAWGIAKLAVMGYNMAIGSNAAQTLKAMKIAQRHDAVNVSIAQHYRTLTAAEQANTSARRTAIITTTQLAISNKKLSAEELSRAVALGKLTKYQAFCAIAQSNLTITQKRYYVEMIKGTKVLGLAQAGVLRLRIAFEGLKASFLALAANPMTWLLAFVSAATYLWSKHNEQMERAKELQESINTVGREGVKNVKDFVNSNIGTRIVGTVEDTDDKGKKIKYDADLTDNYEKYKNTRLYLPAFDTLDQANIKSVMDNAEQFIKEYSATPNAMLNDAFADHGGVVNNLRAQYDSLERSLNTLHKAYAIINNDMKEVMDYSLESTGGWFNDDLIENINDYSKAYRAYKDSITDFISDHEKAAQEGLKAALSEKTFGDAVAATNKALKEKGSPAMSNAQMLQMLLDNGKKFAEANEIFKDNIGVWGRINFNSVLSGRASSQETYRVMVDDLDEAIKSMKEKLKGFGWDFKNLTEAQKQAVAIALAEMVGKATDSTDEIRDKVVALAKEKMGIKLDVEQAEAIAKLNEVKKQLEAICNKTWMIEVGVTGDIETDLPKVDPKYKKSLEDIERYGNALKNAGIIGKVGERAPEVTVNKKPSVLSTDWNPKFEPVSNTSPFSPTDTNLIQAYNKALDDKSDALKWYDTYHMTPPEDSKGGKNGGSKAWKDEFAKRWDERIRIMKEAYDWYEKWRKEYGKDTAFDKVNSRYQDIFKEWKTDKLLPMDFDVKQVADYAKYVRQIKDDALKRYQAQKNDKAKNNGQEALRVFRQAVSLLTDFDWDEIQRKTEEYASTVKRAIDDMSQRWDNYKSILETTGNVSLATQLSGLTPKDVADVNIANNMRRYIRENMSRDVDFNRVYSMSERDIQNYVAEELVGTPVQAEGETDEQYRLRLEGYKEKVRGIVEALKEWQKLQRDVLKDSASTYAKIIGSAQDFRTLIEKNNSKFNEDKKKLDIQLQSGGIDKAQYQKGIDLLSSQLDYDNGKLTAEYLRLINGATAMPKDLFDAEMSKQIMLLNNLFKNGKIGIKEYTDELRKLEEIQKKFDSNGLFGNVSGLSALVTGGIPGLKEYYQKIRDDRETELAKEGKTKEDFKNDEEWSKADKWVAKLDKLADAASDVAAVFGVVTGVLDGFQKGFQSLADMFDALGNEGMANLFSDISDGIGAVTSILTPANNVLQNAMNGNIGGVVSSVISAPFEMIASPITAFSKLHDKGIERKIEKLREEVSKIESNTALIVSLRKRELGYDSGDTRRAMASMYSPKGIVFKGLLSGTWLGQGYKSKAQKDMYEYYTQNSQGSGYSQELANLKAERDNYMEQLNQQEKKKKKSQSDIEATKKKIAELDEQIYYYTQDLAKELWGIDFKSWGQQLSDALATAFENGTNLAEAFDDTVTNILQGLASKMLNLAIVEPMLSSLQETLFGKLNEDGTVTGGIVDLNDMQASAQKVTDYIADYFGKDGEGTKVLTAAQQFLDAYERGLNDAGLSIFNSDLNTLSNAMQGTTEETSNLMAGYVNALRQDVAVNRILLTQFTTEYWNNYIQQITGIQTTLTNIDRNVALIHGLMSENGALYQVIEDINTRLGRFSTGVEKMHMA